MELQFKLKTTIKYTMKVFDENLLNVKFYEFKDGFVKITIRVNEETFDEKKKFSKLKELVKYANRKIKIKKGKTDGKNCIR